MAWQQPETGWALPLFDFVGNMRITREANQQQISEQQAQLASQSVELARLGELDARRARDLAVMTAKRDAGWAVACAFFLLACVAFALLHLRIYHDWSTETIESIYLRAVVSVACVVFPICRRLWHLWIIV